MALTDSAADTKALYDQRYADNYMDTDACSTWGHGNLRTRQAHEILLAVRDTPRSILDYGCGVGAWLERLAHAFPDARLHVVDISGVAIDKVRNFHKLMRKRSLDVLKKRNPLKQTAVVLTRKLAIAADRALEHLTARESDSQKRNPAGTAQYLVFRKE